MEEIHGEEDEERGIEVNWPNKKIEEVKEHHLNKDTNKNATRRKKEQNKDKLPKKKEKKRIG